MARTRPARRRSRRTGPRRLAAALAALALGAGAAQAAFLDRDKAVLQGLDKITARTWELEAPVGTPVRFGTLEITVEACKERPPEETPESAAFLTIVDHRPNEEAADLFHGWMFATRPGLSPLEHAVYDVILLRCE